MVQPWLGPKRREQTFANADSFQYPEGTRQTGSAGVKPFYTDMPDDTTGPLMVFCGTVTPSQSAQFGQYSPIRNGQGWKYSFKWPGKGDGDGDKKQIIYGTRRKNVAGYHAGQTTMNASNGGDIYEYKIHDSESAKIYQACKDDASRPKRRVKDHFDANGKLRIESTVSKGSSEAEDIGGVSEGIQAIRQSQSAADDALDVGEMYLIGSDIYTCSGRNNSLGERERHMSQPKVAM